jgi:hypothetical protein
MPLIDKDANNAVVYQVAPACLLFCFLWRDVLARQGEDKWNLESNGRAVKSYGTDDLRMTIVYR